MLGSPTCHARHDQARPQQFHCPHVQHACCGLSLSFTHSAINPIIYGFMSTNFRKMMMLQCCKDSVCCKVSCSSCGKASRPVVEETPVQRRTVSEFLQVQHPDNEHQEISSSQFRQRGRCKDEKERRTVDSCLETTFLCCN
ncbi:g_PROTEIN_RECEP_F1_2 domain-containing protein [Caerostris darwini]|uniref:G_PROTEIN_RECEP_F1_2 domain-containing protein n=1 Tax=Caerostris darwini TaxID=1538125 RepID=A0AAV4WBQ7_9ARAC|nr:g_PROTEIN_RECEP_F1_2 domain-containing protein [Caerostris darwini]